MKHTEKDLEDLIEEKLSHCDNMPQICAMAETAAGRERICARVKEIVLNDGITDVNAAFAQLESELTFS